MIKKMICSIAFIGLLNISFVVNAKNFSYSSSSDSSVLYRGVNLAGAEFHGGENGKQNDDSPYGFLKMIFPRAEDVNYFRQKGVNTVRIPFSLEYLVPPEDLKNPHVNFNSPYARALIQLVKELTDNKKSPLFVILDMHNYMHYNPDNINKDYQSDDNPIGANDSLISADKYANIWADIAAQFLDNKNVAFALMNEPQGDKLSALQVIQIQKKAVLAIRKIEGTAGFNHLVLYDGAAWSGLHSFAEKNKAAFTAVKAEKDGLDPANYFAIDLHQYFDSNFSGGQESCVDFSGNVKANIEKAFLWFKQNKIKLFIGEFGAPYLYYGSSGQKEPIPTLEICRQNMRYLLDLAVTTYADNVLGFTLWSSGHAWGDYMMNASPGGRANNWWEVTPGTNAPEIFGANSKYFVKH